MSEELFDRCFLLLCDCESLTREANNYAAILRNMKTIDLWKVYRELKKTKCDEDGHVKCNILSEVWNRSVFAGIKRQAWNLFIKICTRVKYHELYQAAYNIGEVD